MPIKHLRLFFFFLFLLPVFGGTYFTIWLDRRFGFNHAFPSNIDQLEKRWAWLIRLLKEKQLIPEVASDIQCEVGRLRPELAFRSDSGVVKIQYQIDGELKHFKLLAKFCPVRGSISNRVIFNILGGQFKEVHFYRKLEKGIGSNPEHQKDYPECYFADYSPYTGNACLILEYLENNLVHAEYPGATEEQLFTAMGKFATFHASSWNCPDETCSKFTTIPEEVAFFFDFVVRNDWGESARKLLIDGWNRGRVEQTLVHGDSRIGNMMFPQNENGRFAFIDFQAVRKGPAAFDIAYFIVLSCPTEVRQAHEEAAMKAYHDALLAHGVKNYDFETFQEDYNHACIEVLTMVALPMLGSEGSFDDHHARVFAFGIDLWHQRISAKFDEFDYGWIASEYQVPEAEAQTAIQEMLKSMKGLISEFEER